jgi:hypothetical protein
MADSGVAAIVGALSTAGLEGFEVANGAPISISSITPGAVTSIGTSATTTALLPILVIAALAVVAIFVLKR